MYASPLSVAGGPRIAGAFIRNVKTLPVSPSSGATNTSSTVQVQAKTLDPFRRTGGAVFQVDRATTFTSPEAQTSGTVSGLGWADTPIAWNSAAIPNGGWYYRAKSSGVRVGSGPPIPDGRYSVAVAFNQAGGTAVRSLYLFVNKAIQTVVAGQGDSARSLYVMVNKTTYPGVLSVAARDLYLFVNKKYNTVVESRSLYVLRVARDGEVFPYLNHIDPVEQFVGGQVSLYGDGFGQYLDARASATLTVSSTNGGNIAGNVRDSTSAEWQSTSGASAWIRFTWGAAKRIVAVVLEGSRNGTLWGVPQFRFDDASTQNGGVSLPEPALGGTAELPVGAQRVAYWLATPKESTYVEIAVASGGSGTNRGISEAWIVEEVEPAENAETARAWLNLDLPSATDMGIVTWMNRSPNWYPANSGLAPLPAGVVTVPVGAVSGLVTVQEET